MNYDDVCDIETRKKDQTSLRFRVKREREGEREREMFLFYYISS